MSRRNHLITLIEEYASARELSCSRIATIVFSSGAMYRRMIEGADITVGRLEAATQWFSDNWPEDKPWPADIERPAKKVAAA